MKARSFLHGAISNLHELIVLPDRFGDFRLGNADAVNVQTRSELVEIVLQRFLQIFVNLIKQVDVNLTKECKNTHNKSSILLKGNRGSYLLQCVHAAKLVKLVMNLVEYQSTVIVGRVVFDNFKDCKEENGLVGANIYWIILIIALPLEVLSMLTTSILSKCNITPPLVPQGTFFTSSD